jgi:hypothetical protein
MIEAEKQEINEWFSFYKESVNMDINSVTIFNFVDKKDFKF